jgi:hypothetical protein
MIRPRLFSRSLLGIAVLSFGLALSAGCGTKAGVEVSPDGTCPACPEPQSNDTPTQFESGSRLRPYEFIANDGTRAWVPQVWFDTVLEAPCAFLSRDGAPEVLCLPDAIYAKPDWFEDASCTKPVAVVDACTSSPNRLPKFVRESEPNGCFPSIKAIRKLGEALPENATLYTNASGECVAQPGALGSANIALPIGEPIPWSDFVAASIAPVAPAP